MKKSTRLVLSRYEGEKIYIGDDIVIDISEIRPAQVRIGITAPADVLILREELVGQSDSPGPG